MNFEFEGAQKNSGGSLWQKSTTKNEARLEINHEQLMIDTIFCTSSNRDSNEWLLQTQIYQYK